MDKTHKKAPIILSILTKTDIPHIVDGFLESNWTVKPTSLFYKYLNEQENNKRVIWVAYLDKQFAGYVTLTWYSLYLPFKENNIPEIMDLNVLPQFRNQGVGTALLDKCELLANAKFTQIGIGVGLYAGYGNAQKLYVKRGFFPNGLGVTHNYEPVIPGKPYPVDDDLLLWFTKELNRTKQ